MPNFLPSLVAAAAALAVSAPALAESDYMRDGWDTIGNKTVNAGVDNDHVRVRGAVRYRKLRLCAVGRPIELRHMNVQFHNGEGQNFPANRFIAAGTCTHAFDLRGRRRNMESIHLTYSPIIVGSQPEVLIQAR